MAKKQKTFILISLLLFACFCCAVVLPDEYSHYVKVREYYKNFFFYLCSNYLTLNFKIFIATCIILFFAFIKKNFLLHELKNFWIYLKEHKQFFIDNWFKIAILIITILLLIKI